MSRAASRKKRFTEHVGWTYARLNEIINGRRGITTESALVIGPELWMNLQRDWDLWHSLQHHAKVRPLKKVG